MPFWDRAWEIQEIHLSISLAHLALGGAIPVQALIADRLQRPWSAISA